MVVHLEVNLIIRIIVIHMLKTESNIQSVFDTIDFCWSNIHNAFDLKCLDVSPLINNSVAVEQYVKRLNLNVKIHKMH